MRTAHFLITHRCNLHCTFCLNAWKDSRTSRTHARGFTKDLSYFQELAVIDALASEGVSSLVITGGEPFLHKHLASLVRHASHQGMKVIIQTNGEFITDAFLDDTRGCVQAIQVSLEGTRREHARLTKSTNFSTVIRNMKRVVAKEIPLMTNFTITNDNKNCLQKYIPLLDALHVSVASFTRLYPAGHGHRNYYELQPSFQELTAFYKELNSLQHTTAVKFFLQGGIPPATLGREGVVLPRATCGAVISEIAIQPNGLVTMCPGSGTILGNILTTPLNVLLTSDAAQAVQRAHRDSSCSGSCLLYKQANISDPLETTPPIPQTIAEPAERANFAL